jgi:hypothetical protein
MYRLTFLALVLLIAACSSEKQTPVIAGEYPAPDEAEITQELIELAKAATEKARKEAPESDPAAGVMRRFNQPANIGCLKASFRLESNLAPELQVGLFAAPGTFPAWVRFANATDGPHTEKDFRGMSIKLTGVSGPKLLGTGDTLDFVLNSYPVLFVGNPEDFRDFADYSLNSSPLLFFLNPFNPHIKEFRIVLAGRRHHPSHLAIPYYSTTPHLFGDGSAVKYAARPCNGGTTAELPDELSGDYLRDAMRGQVATAGACFDFMVQFQTDAESMPIEDATVEWDESISPYRKVARIVIPPQTFESPAQMEFCENLAFNPWRTLPEHRPLGGLNRVRKDLYQTMAEFRHQNNGVNYSEPTGAETF